MKRIALIECLFLLAVALMALPLIADYMAPAGSQRTGSGEQCSMFCGGRMEIDSDGKAFTCSKCRRQTPNVTE